MKKEMNIMEKVGFSLAILLMVPFVLLLMAEPSFNESDPELPNWIAWGWVILMFFSVFLIIVGNMVKKETAFYAENKIKISPNFIIKNLLEFQLLHNISIMFCGSASNAERMSLSLMNRIYELERKPKNSI